MSLKGGGGSAASASPGCMIELGLARSCSNESDWLMPGGNTYPLNPGDAIKCTIPRCAVANIPRLPDQVEELVISSNVCKSSDDK